MRLLHTRKFHLNLFIPGQTPDYVILSHRWGEEEVVFDDFLSGDITSPDHPARLKEGFRKILGACSLAAKDGYEWIWVDSCCIDKSSSAILQESINSMWSYYANSNICYVYMADVPDEVAGWTTQFSNSKWFTRGWTLQELIAPCLVEFYAENWSAIGTKIQRCDEIAARTYITTAILLDPKLVEQESAASRMSWAAHRQVTREEDETYSLLGLFQVNMPMLYGEGRAKAFARLQEAIYNATRDDSLFLFKYSAYTDKLSLLSDCPTRFCPRMECTACQSTSVQCLNPGIKFENIIASEAWSLQAHEHILTTVTPFRFEVSTRLLLLEKSALPQNILPFTKSNMQNISHIAILNHTTIQRPEGSFCLALQRPSAVGDATLRVNAFPVLIRHWKSLLSKANLTRVLFALQLNFDPDTYPFIMEFGIKADSCYAYAWKTNNSRAKLDVHGLGSLDCTCLIRSTSLKLQPLEIQCYLSHKFDVNFQAVLTLRRAGLVWLIKEVAMLSTNGMRPTRKDRANRLVRPQDRFFLHMSNNDEMRISVRRMAVPRLAQTEDQVMRIKTQIGITLVEAST